MVVCSDPDYKDTKLVKQGLKQINPAFQELADWINARFDAQVLNIYYDKIEVDKNRPRLNIIFESSEEAKKFEDHIGNFESTKQKLIVDKFREFQNRDKKGNGNFFTKLFKSSSTESFDTNRLLVIFDAFEPIAREEANKNIPESEIEKLQAEIAMEDLWKIYRQFEVTTFFFYTDKQLEKYSSDGTTELLKQKYYNLLKRYDEFDYIKPNTFFIKFDTKENFDNNYQSSWFYYSR